MLDSKTLKKQTGMHIDKLRSLWENFLQTDELKTGALFASQIAICTFVWISGSQDNVALPECCVSIYLTA